MADPTPMAMKSNDLWPFDRPDTVARILDPALATMPDAEALVGRHVRYTYKQLDRQVVAACVALRDLGVGRGDRVAATAGNGPDIVVAFMAVMRLGAVWVGISAQLAGPEKAYQLKDSGAAVYLADNKAIGQIEPLRDGLPDLRSLIGMDPDEPESEWATLVAAGLDLTIALAPIDRFAPAAIAYTSGTSGVPKGVVHSQHNIMVVAATTWAGGRGDQGPPTMRRGATIPMTILNVMVLTAVQCFIGGGCVVCVDRRDAAGIVEWVRDEGIQHANLSGAHLHDLLHDGTTREDVASLLFLNNAGAGIPVALREAFEAAFGLRSYTSYGMTESLAGISGFSRDAAFVEGSSGTVNGHLEVRIAGADGQALPVGEKGEVLIRARQTGPWAGLYRPMLGYWNKPEETAATLKDGWLHTGDLGSFDKDGHLFLSGRLSEVILRGGANIYPAEIERVLQAVPIVRDAAVIGRPDERLGEIVVAVVELETGVEEDAALPALKQACEAELARYKHPTDWRFMERLPRTAMNKLSKQALRSMFGGA